MPEPSIVIVSPALAAANNGNWQTARRWARLLRPVGRVRLVPAWNGGDEALMIALHARRSAASIRAWREQRGLAPLVLVLTGTDLYRDIGTDADARQSLALADVLVVLNDLGCAALPPALQSKCRVVLQSCDERKPSAKTRRYLRVLMVGHLREEKDPRTYLRAAARLAGRDDIRLDHVGAAIDPTLGELARRAAETHAGYRWLGPLPHALARRRIQAAHVLVHPSRLEGGANVVIEALRSGTPVIASRIAGNVGLLGEDWPALFEPGDDAALARLLERVRDEPAMLADLQRHAALRAPRFAPEAEAAALRGIVERLLECTAWSPER